MPFSWEQESNNDAPTTPKPIPATGGFSWNKTATPAESAPVAIPTVEEAVSKIALPEKKKEGFLGSAMLAVADGLFSGTANFIGGLASIPYKNFSKRMYEQNIVEGTKVTPKDKLKAGTPGYDKQGLATIPDYAVELDNFGEWLREKGKQSSEILQEDSSFEQNKIGTQILKGIGGLVPFAAATYIGKNPGLAVGVVGNAAMNAEDVYDENKAQGKSEDVALKKYSSTFNSTVVINSVLSSFGSFGKIAGNKSILNGKVAEYLKDVLAEVFEENSEQVVQNVNTGKKWYDGLAETTAVTTPIAALLGGFGIGVETQGLSAKQKKPISDFIKNLADRGLTEQETIAVVSGINDKSEEQNRQFISGIIAEDTGIQDKFEKNAADDIKALATDFQTEEDISEIEPFLNEETPADEAMFKKEQGQITDPLYEFKNFETIEDPDIARGTVKDAIKDIGGLRNVKRDFVDVSKIQTTENVNMSSQRAENVRKEVEGGIVTPIILNENLEVMDGHHRLNIYKELGMKDIPVIIPKDTNMQNESVFNANIEKLTKSFTPEQGDMQAKVTSIVDDLANERITEDDAQSMIANIQSEFETSLSPEQKKQFEELRFQETTNKQTVPAQTALDVINKMSKRLGLEFATRVYKKIYTGELVNGSPVQAFGMYLDNTISLAELVTITTGEHEMVHLIFRNLENIPIFKDIMRSDLYAALREIPGNEKLSKIDLEEKLAEYFEQYAVEKEQNKPTTFTGKLKQFLDDLYEALKEILGITRKEYNVIQKFFDTMYFGKSKEVITLYDSNKTSQFMEARFKEFGEEPEISRDVPMFQIQEEYDRHVNDVQIEQIKGRLNNLDAEVKSTEKQIVVLEKKITKAQEKELPTAKLEAELDVLESKWELLDEQRGSLLTLENKMEADLKAKDVTVKGNVIEKVAKMGEKIGEKKGILSEKERQSIRDTRSAEHKALGDRAFELKQLREGITKRLYTKNVLDLLRKDIPRKEWSDYMTRLSQVGLSEAKYLELVKTITERKAELDIENDDRIDRSRMRSNIGYLKKVYDIEPSLILSIKEDLDIRDTYKTGEKAGQKKEALKSIKDYSIEELQFFMDELQNRINFRKENAVKYLNYGKLVEEKTFAQKLGDAIVKVDETLVATMERTLQKISKPVYESMMTVFFQMEKSTSRYSKLMEPVYDIYNKATEADKELIKLAAQSSDETKLRTILEQYGTKEEVDKALKDVRIVLDEIHAQLKEVGVDVPYRGFFFPRKLKELTVAQADLALKIFENKMGKKATGEEKNVIINNFLRGFDVSRLPFVTLSGKKFESHRMIDTLTEDLSPFYEDFGKALNSYVSSAINTIETRKYFGKFQTDSLDYDASLSQSIGAKVYELFDQGIVKQEDLDKLRDIMQTVFQYRVSQRVRAVQELTNSIIYPLTLGQIGSAINQIKDLSLQMLLNDIFSLQMNTIGDLKVKPSDVYLTDSFAELETGAETEGKFAKMAELVLTPFSQTDKSFLRVFINATKRRLIKQAQSGNVRLSKSLTDIFGEEKGMEVMNDLKNMDTSNSVLSDEIARVIWGEVAKVRPITKLQKTRTAVRHPYLYTLRNFMMKQIQFVRSQSLDMITEGVKTKDKKMIAEGIGRFAVMMAVIGFFGAGVDELKDFILGKSDDKGFWDRVTDNLLQVVGFNSYLLSMGERNGYGQQFLYSYIPASASVIAQTLDAVVQDVQDTIDGDPIYEAKTLRKFPLVGELFYQRFGGGAD